MGGKKLITLSKNNELIRLKKHDRINSTAKKSILFTEFLILFFISLTENDSLGQYNVVDTVTDHKVICFTDG